MAFDEVPAEVLDLYEAWIGKTLVPKPTTARDGDDATCVYEEDISYSPYRICVNGRATRDFHPHRLNFDTENNVVRRVWRG
ncbi:hypothetical protein SPRG_08036 [Saprolegnia parasitica CBS 223.65]|uniref:Uncharacterized protein n=1 Tax=Saprolegnia parasitica (strain CBS 223.65) TaxID=695850 RepID=A0A067CIL2_SAPPC|nr:hypothetical protein SPRG_08036 [Saprolegnia parasitica CBS 223.65]KDO26632.1 hypothetical protein SPRG_08036 [Saprolegnia parasitica CBS 223.65]|eukprot:XP_012202771.1 hypothetical protein SPRG_08036 [Saprolegnia parasitica CBS 223.65]